MYDVHVCVCVCVCVHAQFCVRLIFMTYICLRVCVYVCAVRSFITRRAWAYIYI